MQKRNIGISIFLSIITCGIYGIFWFISLTDDTNAVSGQSGTTGGMAFLLSLVTCGIYGIYWAYRVGEKIDTAWAARGRVGGSDTKIIYLLLSIFGLSIITWALAQNELNKIIDNDAPPITPNV